MDLEETLFDTGEVLINVAEGPDNGPPLLLLPGFTNSLLSFRLILPALVSQAHVYALDYRGHGKSGRKPPEQYRFADYYADVGAVLRQHIDQPVFAAGMSMGAGISLLLAANEPALVRGLILGDPPPFVSPPEPVQEVESSPEERPRLWKYDLAGRPVAELRPLLAARDTPLAEADEIALLDKHVMDFYEQGRMDAFYDGFVPPVLSRITCPVLLIQGNPALGGIVSDAEVACARVALPQIEHVFISHAGHDLGFWRGDVGRLQTAMLDFLAQHATA